MNNSNKKWQTELRRKLEREAFNEKYECFVCGKKEGLHIHHLVYSTIKEEYFDPNSYTFLCINCHAKTPKDVKIITGIKEDYRDCVNVCHVCEEILTRKSWRRIIINSQKISLCPTCFEKALDKEKISKA